MGITPTWRVVGPLPAPPPPELDPQPAAVNAAARSTTTAFLICLSSRWIPFQTGYTQLVKRYDLDSKSLSDFGHEEVLGRQTAGAHPLLGGPLEEPLERGAGGVDAVGPEVGAQELPRPLGVRRTPRHRKPGRVGVERPLHAAPLGLLERRIEVH